MCDDEPRIERKQKPRKCPECKFSPVATILYGMPAYSEKLQEDMLTGRVTLGGCCVTNDDPEWECSRCGLLIYRKGWEY